MQGLKVSPFFSILKNGNKYFAYSEASGLVELNEDEFNNITSLEELKEIRMLIPDEEKKINVVVNKVNLSHHLINIFNSIEEVPEGETVLVVSSNIDFLVNFPISRFKKVLIAYIMDPFRFFIYNIKNNGPCMYEIYLWLKNSRLILDVKIDGVVIREANPTLNAFAELLLLGLSKLLLNSDKFDGKLIYIDLLEGDLIINTPLKIPGCPKCGI